MEIFSFIFIIAVLVVLLLMYAHYRFTLKSTAEQSAVAEETLMVKHDEVDQLKKMVAALGTRYMTTADAAVSSLLEMPVWNRLAISKAAGKAMEEFLYHFLETIQGTILEELIRDGNADDMFSEEPHKQYFKIAGGEPAENVVLEFEITRVPMAEVDDAEALKPFSRDNGESVIRINSLVIYTPKECQGECPTNTITTASQAAAACKVQVKRIRLTNDELLPFRSYKPASSSWTYQTAKKNRPTPQILSLSYPALQMRGEKAQKMTVTKLLSALRESWSTGESVRVAFLGDPGTGKSRLLHVLACAAHEAKLAVIMVSVANLKDILQNGAFESIPRGDNGALVIIDEANAIPTSELGALNSQLEGVMPNSQISFAIAANGELDPTTLRQGRIDLALQLGALSPEDTEKLYVAAKTEHPELHWSPLTTGASLTLAGVFGLGRKKSFMELL